MRHFGYLSAAQVAALFERPPEHFDRGSGTDLLSVALGATLYMPADRPSLVADITKQTAAGVTSVVVCLEDAIADEQVATAEENLVEAFSALHGDAHGELPLLFVRVREAAQIPALLRRLGQAACLLDGFVLPKFTEISGTEYLLTLEAAEREAGVSLLAMPVIESGAVLYAETRVDELTRLRALLHRDRRRILAVRIGATDLCALYGLRRSPELTIYDVKVVSAVIGDVVNVLGRADGTGFTVTGPVWEYFGGHERIFKPQLRAVPVPPARRAAPARRADLARDRRADPRDPARPGQRPRREDRHPPRARRRRARALGGLARGVPRRAGHPRRRASRWRDALRVPQQDERDPPAPGLGAAHDAAVAGVRGRGRGRLLRRSPRARLMTSTVVRLGAQLRARGAGPDPRVLLGLALRDNPRRAQLLVSRVLGKHVPTDPRVVHAAGLLLGELVADTLAGRPPRPLPVDLLHAAVLGTPGAAAAVHATAVRGVAPEPVDAVVLGFAETATALGHCVADALGGADYLHSTRRPVTGVATAGAFDEEHSHAHRAPAAAGRSHAAGRPAPAGPGRRRAVHRSHRPQHDPALHSAAPRAHYVLATLVDLREHELADLPDGVRVDVVALTRACLTLPTDLAERATALRAELGRAEHAARPVSAPVGRASASTGARTGPVTLGYAADPAAPPHARVLLTDLGWPAGLPAGGRHGFTAAHHGIFGAALPGLAADLVRAADVRPAERTSCSAPRS